MTRRRKRTKEEIALWDQRFKTAKEREEWYGFWSDKPDDVDWYGDPDEEVSKTGTSLRTRVAQRDRTDRYYAHYRVQPREYKITLTANGRTLIRKSIILQDHWYD